MDDERRSGPTEREGPPPTEGPGTAEPRADAAAGVGPDPMAPGASADEAGGDERHPSRRTLLLPTAATVAVLLLSPGAEVLTGDPAWYGAAPTILLVLFWALVRLPAASVGLRGAPMRAWATALLYPVAAVGVTVLIAWRLGVVDGTGPAGAGPDGDPIGAGGVAGRMLLMGCVIAVGSLLADEGFFRGWLWAALERAGLPAAGVLLWTGLAFALWHLPLFLIEEGFRLPADVAAIQLGNALLLGMNWGVLRAATGSVWVPALSHGAWGGTAYVLFGFGTEPGLLGIEAFHAFGPERGVLGLVVNLVAFLVLHRLWLDGALGDRFPGVEGAEPGERGEAERRAESRTGS